MDAIELSNGTGCINHDVEAAGAAVGIENKAGRRIPHTASDPSLTAHGTDHG